VTEKKHLVERGSRDAAYFQGGIKSTVAHRQLAHAHRPMYIRLALVRWCPLCSLQKIAASWFLCGFLLAAVLSISLKICLNNRIKQIFAYRYWLIQRVVSARPLVLISRDILPRVGNLRLFSSLKWLHLELTKLGSFNLQVIVIRNKLITI